MTTAMAGLLVGLDTGLIAEALGFIGHDFHASARAQEWVVSVLMIGALLGSLGLECSRAALAAGWRWVRPRC